jgi:hypothetical protein
MANPLKGLFRKTTFRIQALGTTALSFPKTSKKEVYIMTLKSKPWCPISFRDCSTGRRNLRRVAV